MGVTLVPLTNNCESLRVRRMSSDFSLRSRQINAALSGNWRRPGRVVAGRRKCSSVGDSPREGAGFELPVRECNESGFAIAVAAREELKVCRLSPLEGDGFEPVWGFSCQ